MLAIALSLETLFHLVQNSIGLESLSIRRDLMDIMFVYYDILNNYINCPEILNLIGFRIPIVEILVIPICSIYLFRKFKTNCGNKFLFSIVL